MDFIETIEDLELALSEPPPPVVELMRRLEGDMIFLGAAGKIGPSLIRMAQRADTLAGRSRRLIAVSRFTHPGDAAKLRQFGVETIQCDLLDEARVAALPEAANILYLPALKFGSSARLPDTWAVNTYLPSVICRRYARSRIVAYSTGAVYGLSEAAAGGRRESDSPDPSGEYAASCLGRDRMFQYFSERDGIAVALIRLFYACELRYGVLVDLAQKILAGSPIDLAMGYFNAIWQGDSNAATLLAFDHAASPPFVVNVTGMERLGIRETALRLGRLLGVEPRFAGAESATALLGDATLARRLFGPPRVSAERLMDWVAHWLKHGGATLGKPTHFEVRNGRY